MLKAFDNNRSTNQTEYVLPCLILDPFNNLGGVCLIKINVRKFKKVLLDVILRLGAAHKKWFGVGLDSGYYDALF